MAVILRAPVLLCHHPSLQYGQRPTEGQMLTPVTSERHRVTGEGNPASRAANCMCGLQCVRPTHVPNRRIYVTGGAPAAHRRMRPCCARGRGTPQPTDDHSPKCAAL